MTAPIANRSKPRFNGFPAARWAEPVVMELGCKGRRGVIFEDAPAPELPGKAARKVAPALPEMTEHDALRHYLHLSQMTLGMMGVSLFGTCTMK